MGEDLGSLGGFRVGQGPGRGPAAAMLRAALCACALVLAAAAAAAPLGPDRTARMLAGLEGAANGEPRISAPLLQRHARAANHWWNDYERRIGVPLRDWAAMELPPTPGTIVFYPFSGPDFPTVQRLFPDAGRYVLVALQRAGAPPALDRASAADLDAFVERFDTAWRQFAQIGFFRTLDLDAEARRADPRVSVTAVLMAFAARLGYEVVAVEPVRVDTYGTDLEVHPGDRSDPATWESVRLVLARDARLAVLDYVRTNLADAALAVEPEHRAWIERMAGQWIVIKAASHLLQRREFSILRDAILEHAAGVVQDETGIDYERLAQAFNVKLYGRFTRPHRLFGAYRQRSLADAYLMADPKPLAFKLSYQRETGANLQVAQRPATPMAAVRGAARTADATPGALPARER